MAQIVLSPPSRGFRTQHYGENPNPDYQPGGHTGDDWAYTDGVTIFPEVLAMDDGVVVWADWSHKLGWPNRWHLNPDFNKNDFIDESAGIVVALQHWYGETTYSHLEETPLNIGDTVKRGQRIGTVGNTGRSYGKHLHAELILYPFNFNTPTYGRTDPARFMTGTLTAQSSTAPAPTPQKESEMPEHIHLASTFKARHRLPKGETYTLSVKDDGAAANFALNGPGHYSIHNYIRGEGLLDGQKITAQFVVTTRGKASGHFQQDILGSSDGKFAQAIHFDRPIVAGTTVTCTLVSRDTDTAYCTGFGAEITTYK